MLCNNIKYYQHWYNVVFLTHFVLVIIGHFDEWHVTDAMNFLSEVFTPFLIFLISIVYLTLACKPAYREKKILYNWTRPLSPVHRARYSTNWERKGWPGSDIQMYYGYPWCIKSNRVNLVAPASPVHRARYSTNWERKGWPGSNIQMYYVCRCYIYPTSSHFSVWSWLCFLPGTGLINEEEFM